MMIPLSVLTEPVRVGTRPRSPGDLDSIQTADAFKLLKKSGDLTLRKEPPRTFRRFALAQMAALHDGTLPE
jgi:hypothetical protein